MIITILRIFWIHLRRDRVVWLLTFIVPVAFFSIFAIIFSGSGRNRTPAVRVAVVDEDGSDFSKKLVAALDKDKGLRVTARLEAKEGDPGRHGTALARQDAEALVRDGSVSAAIILPKGLGQSFPSFSGDRPTVEVLADTSDPVAPQMLSGMLQGLVMTAAPEAMMHGGIDQLAKWGGGLTPEQLKVVEQAEQRLKLPAPDGGLGRGAAGSGLLAVKVVDLLGQAKTNPVVSFYAAATAVMFLLFSCAAYSPRT
jgi:ABC-2 type transport system permease protein